MTKKQKKSLQQILIALALVILLKLLLRVLPALPTPVELLLYLIPYFVVGKDVLLETQPDVYELLDLQLGRCRLAVAAKNGWQEDLSLPLRVATKYPRVAKEYYEAQGRQIEIIRLNGSIELAPILGLSDVIVDIVETGTTLKENDLGVFADVAQSSARLIANKASYQFSAGVIDGICGKLREKL